MPPKPARAGGVDAFDDLRVPVAPRELEQPLRAQGVEAHRQAAESCRPERSGLAREQHAVGREREIVQPVVRSEERHERRKVVAQQRLAAGEPHLGHTEAREDARQARPISSKVRIDARGSHTYSASGMQ